MPTHENEVAPWVIQAVEESTAQGWLLRLNYTAAPHPEGMDQRSWTEFLFNQEVVKPFVLFTELFLVVHEVGHGGEDAEANPHYHFLFFSSAKKDTICNRIRKYWQGNAKYSLSKAKPEKIPEHVLYMCKGSGSGSDDLPDVIDSSTHFTHERIVELHALYWKNNAAIQAKGTKRKFMDVSQNIFHLCKHLKPPINRCEIYDIVYAYYKKRLKYWNPDYVRKLVYQTQMYLEPSNSQCNVDMKSYCVGLPFGRE